VPRLERAGRDDDPVEVDQAQTVGGLAGDEPPSHRLSRSCRFGDEDRQTVDRVRANRGAAGIDKQSIADVEQYGVDQLLDGLTADLNDVAGGSDVRAGALGFAPHKSSRGSVPRRSGSAVAVRAGCSWSVRDRRRSGLLQVLNKSLRVPRFRGR
jgi:hypothetical protein